MIGTEDYVSHAFRAKFTDAKTGRQNVVGENFTSDELLKEDSFNFGLTLFQAIAGVGTRSMDLDLDHPTPNDRPAVSRLSHRFIIQPRIQRLTLTPGTLPRYPLDFACSS